MIQKHQEIGKNAKPMIPMPLALNAKVSRMTMLMTPMARNLITQAYRKKEEDYWTDRPFCTDPALNK